MDIIERYIAIQIFLKTRIIHDKDNCHKYVVFKEKSDTKEYFLYVYIYGKLKTNKKAKINHTL